MKDLVFKYQIKLIKSYKSYGHSVKFSEFELTDNTGNSSFNAIYPNSQIVLVDKFKFLIENKIISEKVAEELLDMIYVYTDDKITEAIDDERLSNAGDDL